ncbi:ABC transporter substrate-binding protein [Ruania alba]|uniref:Raffinose/stachyose/melibiose transport system substrate-binding protein n=1 Tax=Ruania alba TaxID=648782 RepID=A0A1H5EYG4_9MICO|nr:extracellular solute-binding protein [Ruania alba]SED96171.1 raffinose/stachyose/melibiose transport system substrate-binding protein [Ruania alba]
MQRDTTRRLALTLGSALALALASCSSNAASESDPDSLSTDEPITLTVQQQPAGEGMMAHIATAFEEANPNVTVELVTVSVEQKTGSNLATLASNSPPDVGLIPINSEVYTQLIRAEALADLTPVWESADLDSRFGQSGESLKTDGVPYVATYTSVGYNIVYYNPDLFAEVGIEAPQNHRFDSIDQLVEAADELRAAGYGPLQIGGSSGNRLSWMIDAFLPTVTTEEEMANYLGNYNPDVEVTAEYASAPFVDVIETIDGLGAAGVFQDGFLGQDSPIAEGPFIQGLAGMVLGATASVANFTDAEFTPEWALLPPMDGGSPTQMSMYFGDALGVPENAPNRAWAMEFIEFVLSDQMQEEAVVGVGASLPSVNSLPDDALAQLPEISQQFLADIRDNGGQPGWTATVPGGFGQQFIDPLVQDMLAGELSPAEVAQTQQDHLLETRENAG